VDLEAPSVSGKTTGGFLDACLVEGDSADERRSRKLKRRALAISILLQLAFLAALLLFPLLGKSERISPSIVTPLPPYSPVHGDTELVHRRVTPTPQPPCFSCIHFGHPIITTASRPSTGGEPGNPDPGGPLVPGLPLGPGVPGGLTPTTTTAPQPPEPVEPPRKTRVHIGAIESALLIRRVEPIYPELPKQIGREGRVELHAIIATDGSIQSLEIISGDPLFYQSALAAVRAWRYRPTYLNGQAVEVDTHISVIYSLNRNR
jgi:TonB family protein